VTGRLALTVRGVTVRVGPRALLEDVGFDASPGEVVAVIGPNGAGKTTLLEAVLGLRRVDSGAVTFGGVPLVRFADRARTMAYLPDSTEPPPELTVRECVAHALRFRPRGEPLLRALRASLSMDRLADSASGVLSRGERQRVALFCALAVERPVVVLDEPFSAFDPLQLRGVLDAVRRVAASGVAVVTTVHQLADAQKVADRLLLLSEGRRVAWGDLSGLRAQAGLTGGGLDEVFVALLEGGPRAT
jgi:ABC-2 type transport system ATP-binding protein